MCCIFSDAAVIYPLKPEEHLAAEQLQVGSVMREECHRPPSLPRAPLHTGAEPTLRINLPDAMRLSLVSPTTCNQHLCFHVPLAADSQMHWLCTIYLRLFEQ